MLPSEMVEGRRELDDDSDADEIRLAETLAFDDDVGVLVAAGLACTAKGVEPFKPLPPGWEEAERADGSTSIGEEDEVEDDENDDADDDDNNADDALRPLPSPGPADRPLTRLSALPLLSWPSPLSEEEEARPLSPDVTEMTETDSGLPKSSS